MRFNSRRTRMIVALAATAAAIGTTGASAVNAEPQGHQRVEDGVGLFYGTFEDERNLTMLVGGDVEAFCIAGPGGDAGKAPGREFSRNGGVVETKVNAKDQRAFIYDHPGPGGPVFLDAVCSGAMEPELYAEGRVDLKVRETDTGDGFVDTFNSVNGTVATDDGTTYKVQASADFVLGPMGPVGDPAEFVDFRLQEIRRR